MFYISMFIRYMSHKYILTIYITIFFCWRMPLLCEAVLFDMVLPVYFCFCWDCICCQIQKIIAKINVKELTTWNSSRSFMVSGPMFKPLIFFELIVVCSTKYVSSFTHLHVAVQFPEQYLLKKLYFPHCIFFAALEDASLFNLQNNVKNSYIFTLIFKMKKHRYRDFN